MTVSRNAPAEINNVVAFPTGRNAPTTRVIGGGGAVLDFLKAQSAGKIDFGGWYHEAAVEEDRTDRLNGKH